MAAPSPELHIVEQAHNDLGISMKQIAAVIGADESTLHDWLNGSKPSRPRHVHRQLEALCEFYTELRAAFPTLEAARRWLHEATPPAFGGITPLQALLEGKIERVSGLLWNVNNGMLS
jgi:hypothetical protein